MGLLCWASSRRVTIDYSHYHFSPLSENKFGFCHATYIKLAVRPHPFLAPYASLNEMMPI